MALLRSENESGILKKRFEYKIAPIRPSSKYMQDAPTIWFIEMRGLKNTLLNAAVIVVIIKNRLSEMAI